MNHGTARQRRVSLRVAVPDSAGRVSGGYTLPARSARTRNCSSAHPKQKRQRSAPASLVSVPSSTSAAASASAGGAAADALGTTTKHATDKGPAACLGSSSSCAAAARPIARRARCTAHGGGSRQPQLLPKPCTQHCWVLRGTARVPARVSQHGVRRPPPAHRRAARRRSRAAQQHVAAPAPSRRARRSVTRSLAWPLAGHSKGLRLVQRAARAPPCALGCAAQRGGVTLWRYWLRSTAAGGKARVGGSQAQGHNAPLALSRSHAGGC